MRNSLKHKLIIVMSEIGIGHSALLTSLVKELKETNSDITIIDNISDLDSEDLNKISQLYPGRSNHKIEPHELFDDTIRLIKKESYNVIPSYNNECNPNSKEYRKQLNRFKKKR